jgi:hypothetical protein
MMALMLSSSKQLAVCTAIFMVTLLQPVLAFPATPTDDLSKDIQHLGPMVLIHSDDEVPNPEDTAQAMLSDNPARKLSGLQALGIDRYPAIHQLWQDLQKSQNVASEQLAALWTGGSIPWDIYDQNNEKYQFLSFDLSKQAEPIFSIEAVIQRDGGKFKQVATLACLCSGSSGFSGMHSDWMGSGKKIYELVNVVTLHDAHGWQESTTRFRILHGKLEAVLRIENDKSVCEFDDPKHKPCSGSGIWFQYTPLIDQKGRRHLGATVSQVTWTESSHEMGGRMGKPCTCTPLIWNETTEAYQVVDWRSRSCGKLPQIPSIKLID